LDSGGVRSPQRDIPTRERLSREDEQMIVTSPPLTHVPSTGSPRKRTTLKFGIPSPRKSSRTTQGAFDDLEVSAPFQISSSPQRHAALLRRSPETSSETDSEEVTKKNVVKYNTGLNSSGGFSRSQQKQQSNDELGTLGYYGAEEKLSDLLAEIESGLVAQKPHGHSYISNVSLPSSLSSGHIDTADMVRLLPQ